MSTDLLHQHSPRNNDSNQILQINTKCNDRTKTLSNTVPATGAQQFLHNQSGNNNNNTPTKGVNNSGILYNVPTTPILSIQQNRGSLRGKIVDQTELVQKQTKNAKPTACMLQSVDIIGNVLGDFGIWQLRSVLILFLCKIPASWFMACIIYTAPEIRPHTQYRCDSSELSSNETISENQCYIFEWHINVSTKPEVLSQEPCTDFIYDDNDFYSLIMQFNLVCFREIFVAWTQYWHLFGVLVGGILGTKAMLKLSPRTVYIIGAVLQIGMGVITGYSPGLTLHCIFRCLSAVCCAIMFTSSQAIFVDITAGRYRTGIIILYDTFWSLGVILLPGLSSYFKSWNQLYLGITFPTVILLFLLHWTPESPRWLLKNGNEQDVHRVEHMIRKAVDINERTFLIPDDFRQQLEMLRNNLRSQKPPATWLQLWHGPRAVNYIMLAAHIALACYIVNYMGMLLNLRSFGRDYRVPNTIAMGIAEIFGCFIALHIVMRQGQKKFLYAGLFNIIAGCIGCLGWSFTGLSLDPNLKVALWMLIAVVPKMSVSCAQSMMQGCMAELMPPNKKQPFVFSVVTWARIWLLTAPFINVLKNYDDALPLTVFSLLSVLGGICTCFLQPKKQKNKAHASSVMTRNDDNQRSNNKECSPLNITIFTVEGESYNTRL